MDAINELLDKCMEIRSLSTDAELCKLLEVKKQTLSNWRHGERQPDPISCAKISEITGEPLARVIGLAGEARAISRDEKLVWKRLAQVAVLIICTLPMASVFAAGSVSTSRNSPAMYIM